MAMAWVDLGRIEKTGARLGEKRRLYLDRGAVWYLQGKRIRINMGYGLPWSARLGESPTPAIVEDAELQLR
jgi:hypothetical protein